LLVPNGLKARLLAIRPDTTVIVAPVSNARLALTTPFNVTGTTTDEPLIATGTVMVFRAELPGSDDGAIVIDDDGSAGKALKNFSSFLDSSVSLCLIHPTVPFLALTKYHLTFSPTKVSANGEISSLLFKVATIVEDSSGVVNSCISLPVGRE
jgi:hypothetical protein